MRSAGSSGDDVLHSLDRVDEGPVLPWVVVLQGEDLGVELLGDLPLPNKFAVLDLPDGVGVDFAVGRFLVFRQSKSRRSDVFLGEVPTHSPGDTSWESRSLLLGQSLQPGVIEVTVAGKVAAGRREWCFHNSWPDVTHSWWPRGSRCSFTTFP
jgi:hypothetical protein